MLTHDTNNPSALTVPKKHWPSGLHSASLFPGADALLQMCHTLRQHLDLSCPKSMADAGVHGGGGRQGLPKGSVGVANGPEVPSSGTY